MSTDPYASEPNQSSDGAHAHQALGHVIPVRLLVSVFLALILLTALTVAVTRFDLGSYWNLVVAMAVATIKGALVAAVFMHLFWDRKFYLLAFSGSILFVVLFLATTMADRAEYQPSIDRLEQARQSSSAAP